MIKPIDSSINLPFGYTPYGFAPTNPDGTSFGYRHHGVDLYAAIGTNVKAPEGGKVLYSGLAGTAGEMVQIQGPTGVHRLLHNSQRLVGAGATVSEGQVVAKSGYSGLVEPPGPAGAHLHWDLAVGGKYVNPMQYLSQEPPMQKPTEADVRWMFDNWLGYPPTAKQISDYIQQDIRVMYKDILFYGLRPKLPEVEEAFKKLHFDKPINTPPHSDQSDYYQGHPANYLYKDLAYHLLGLYNQLKVEFDAYKAANPPGGAKYKQVGTYNDKPIYEKE